MDAETKWNQRAEWAEAARRGLDIEIKTDHEIVGERCECMSSECAQAAVWRYEIGRADCPNGKEIDLCADHNSEENAFELYDMDNTGGN